MNELEKQLLIDETGGSEPGLCIRSKTRIDAGCWWRRTPVWICIVSGELILFAVARRRHVERVALADCQASYYSQASGELAIQPSESLKISRVALPPGDALRILTLLKSISQPLHAVR